MEVRSPEENPEEWAETQANLGNAYWERIDGYEREDDLDLGIEAYKSALSVYTPENFPYRWAATQNNLGNAYSDRFRGDREENLSLAIAACKLALQIRTREALPQQWAMTQNNLGKAYRTRMSGSREENLQKTIEAYESTLEIFTYEAFPYNWALTQNNLGMVYRDLGKIDEAIICFKEALKIHTPITFPRDCLNSAWNLGRTFFISERWTEAIEYYDTSITALEESRNWASTDSRKEDIVSEAIDVYENIVQACINSMQFEKAIEYVERSKTRNLVDLILERDAETIFPFEVVTQLEQLRDEIASSQYQLQNANADNPSVLVKQIQKLRQQRNELQNRYLPLGDKFNFKNFQAGLDKNTVVIEFYVTENNLTCFIFSQQMQDIKVWQSEKKYIKKLENWANGYIKAYYLHKNNWQHRLETRINLLAKILHIDEILKYIPEHYNRLIIIPHRYLHLFPLHTLPLSEGTALFERFSGGISYAPSCQLFQLAQKRERPNFNNFVAFQNPTEDLPYADVEVAAVSSSFSMAKILEKQQATKTAIYSQDLSSAHCAHFSCHGQFNLQSPRESALLLANGELLTLGEIFALNLNQCRLIVLSACETGLIDFNSLSDEYVGLPSGFLYAGAANVVSSLWSVDQVSTAFLLINFYQNLKSGLSVAIALNQAQLWLRDVTTAELKKWVSELKLEEEVAQQIQAYLYWLPSDKQLYQDPYYWAAFCAVGK
ncbi:CHAT domain-containing protein [Dapis sp. BLCC M229]|uniref:CHAT domain-containing protein n=1 Tax=Dapis sp. BLCC M229 TaxID=3400188 RepID=UPI003CFA1459